ncbi:MAG: right-handed parallel beta-helix repeat-containing protein [Methylocella sp.]
MLRPPWQVAGVDYPVGVPSTATLTDWQCLSGPGIVVHATATPPAVSVYNTSNVVISGVDFSLHGGAHLYFVNSPNPTVISSLFAGKNLTMVVGDVIYADADSPNLTVSYNIINGAGAGNASALVGASGGGTTTLTYNWLKNFPQHVLELNTTGGGPYSLVYTNNLIERGATQPGAHLNYLQFETYTDSLSVAVEYNTSYQTRQASGGEGYQFASGGTGLVKNVRYAHNVEIAAAPGTPLPVPTSLYSMSVLVHAGGLQNAGVAHANYIDRTAAFFWFYGGGSYAGWRFTGNYDMTTGALETLP